MAEKQNQGIQKQKCVHQCFASFACVADWGHCLVGLLGALASSIVRLATRTFGKGMREPAQPSCLGFARHPTPIIPCGNHCAGEGRAAEYGQIPKAWGELLYG